MRRKNMTVLVVFGVLLGCFEVAWALDPIDQAQLLLEAGNVDQAIALLRSFVESEKDEERLGVATEILDSLLSERGETGEAIAVLQGYITRFPETPRSHLFRYWIAKHEEERGNFEKAFAILEELRHRLPQDDPFALRFQVLSDLAYHLEHRKKDYFRALEVYRELVNLSRDPEERLQAEMALGSCYEKVGEIEEALKIYKAVVEEAPGSFFERWARLRMVYLTEPKAGAKSKEELAHALAKALRGRDLAALRELVKRGDFWSGVNFSEFDVDDPEKALEYMAQYLPKSSQLVVSEDLKPRDDTWVLRVEGWGDPEYNILYLVLAEGRYGWEWKGLILSSTALEACEENAQDQDILR